MNDPTPLHSEPAANLGRVNRRVFIRDLVLEARIGIHSHEQNHSQRVRINVNLLVGDDAPLGDDIRHVVSYETVVDGIHALLAAGHINLVETLADRIVAQCFADSRIEHVRVRVEKLDIYEDAESVGVEVESTRGSA
jgi:dihydroneopterin aldolase